jgi:hypothetical protein
LYILIFTVLIADEKKTVLNWIVASITRI